MVLFGLLNYEDYIFNTIATSSYAKNTLTIALMYLITGIVRFHLSMIFSWLFSFGCIIDYVTPIIINVMLSFLSSTLYQYVGTHRDHYETLVTYLMENYSIQNMIRWKRYVLTFVFTYVMLALLVIPIDNMFLIVGTLQTAASFVICDILENRESVRAKIEEFMYTPQVTKILKDFTIIHNYPINEGRMSPPIPVKPRTPPRQKRE